MGGSAARLGAVALILAGVLGVQPASGAIVGTCPAGALVGDLCTITGAKIIFEYSVDDAAGKNPGINAFGEPQLFPGDVIRFIPPSFLAKSTDGGTVTNEKDFIFTSIRTISGDPILGIQLTEFGDYEITNSDGNNTDRVEVDMTLVVASNIDAFDFGSSTTPFSAVGDSGGQQNWLISTTWTPDDNENPFGGPFDSADNNVRIENRLEAATTGLNDVAFIQKKITLTTVVPIPAAAWLFGSALGLLGLARRRTRRAD